MLMRHGIQGNAKFAIISGRGPTLALTAEVGAEFKSPTDFRIYSLFRKLIEHFVHQFGFELNAPREE